MSNLFYLLGRRFVNQLSFWLRYYNNPWLPWNYQDNMWNCVIFFAHAYNLNIWLFFTHCTYFCTNSLIYCNRKESKSVQQFLLIHAFLIPGIYQTLWFVSYSLRIRLPPFYSFQISIFWLSFFLYAKLRVYPGVFFYSNSVNTGMPVYVFACSSPRNTRKAPNASPRCSNSS